MKLGENYTGNEMLEIVKQRGYFEIRFIPNSANNFSLTDLEDIIGKIQIKHRGLFYPHIANHKFGKFQKVGNYIESFHQWGDGVEIWRFYKSGQFKHFRGFMEDRWENNPPLGMQWNPAMEAPMPEHLFFEPIVKILEMTEMFLFASKLANKLECELKIEIKLHKMKNRQLEIRTRNRSGLGLEYICHTDPIVLDPLSINANELEIKHDELAEKKILEIFDYFGWNATPNVTSLIKTEQKKFYSLYF